MERALAAVAIAFTPIAVVCLAAFLTGIPSRPSVLVAAMCCTALLLSFAAVRAGDRP